MMEEDDPLYDAFGELDCFPDEYTEAMYYSDHGQPHRVGLPYWERCVDYPGTLLDFQALLNHIGRKYKWRWPGVRYEKFHIETYSKPTKGYARWEIVAESLDFDEHGDPDIRSIAIEAYEEPNGHTFIYFMDSKFRNERRDEYIEPIGDDFLKIIDTIISEMPGAKVVPEPDWKAVDRRWSIAPAVPPTEHKDVSERPPEAEDAHVNDEPWKKIPDHSWHQKAVKLWWEGYSIPEIATRLHIAAKTIANQFSIWRKMPDYGTEIVPTADQLHKMKRR